MGLIQPAIRVVLDREEPLEWVDPLGTVILSSSDHHLKLEQVWLDDCLESLVEGVLRLEQETVVVIEHHSEPLRWVLDRDETQVRIGVTTLNSEHPESMVAVGRLANFRVQLRAIAQALINTFEEACGSVPEAFPALRNFVATNTAR